MINLQLSKKMNFSLDYEEEDGCVISIYNVWQMHEGARYKEHKTPSIRLENNLIEAIQKELDK